MGKGRSRARGGQRDRTRAERERDLELLAIEEPFAAEHAAGRAPRLAGYAATYPEHTAALADFVTEYLDDESRRAPDAPDAPLSAGTLRALDLLFPDATPRPARRVAETAQAYGGPRSARSSAGPSPYGDVKVFNHLLCQ